ncbi:unnamed protein product [Polarella glacialis]|uniref:SGNH hydrolase-type esterase domain-containing protein n=1 Tax=Polarella glacialis TaxID=89957 RepID=A0A813HN35_POLGL|nr:unnamed protein product [Polarella glacialis]
MALPPLLLLIAGSSVSAGTGASSSRLGWAAQFANVASQHGFAYVNAGMGGTNVAFWNAVLGGSASASDPTAQQFLTTASTADLVVFSLSLGNEGLRRVSRPQDVERVERHYTEGLHRIAQSLRALMKSGARLVLGGPYPNQGYQEQHLQVLLRVLATMRTWSSVDHVIDFLVPVVHDGQGHWHDKSWVDDGHPNDQGHKEMFESINSSAAFGPFFLSCSTATTITTTTTLATTTTPTPTSTLRSSGLPLALSSSLSSSSLSLSVLAVLSVSCVLCGFLKPYRMSGAAGGGIHTSRPAELHVL